MTHYKRLEEERYKKLQEMIVKEMQDKIDVLEREMAEKYGVKKVEVVLEFPEVYVRFFNSNDASWPDGALPDDHYVLAKDHWYEGRGMLWPDDEKSP